MVLPFLDTKSLTDVRLLFLLLPLWWFLGIEQFVWLAGLGLGVFKLVAQNRGRLLMTRPAIWYALYLVVILVSSLFIVEQFRWFTFARNLSAYLAGFSVFLIITNQARNWTAIELTARAVVLSVILAAVLGLLGIVGVLQFPFSSAFGQLLPESIASTSYGQRIVARSIGQLDWFAGLGQYFRLTSLYLFSTHYATALVLAIPFLFFYLHISRGVKRLVIISAILLLSLNLFYTTGRVAILSLLAGFAYFNLFHSHQKRPMRVLAFTAASVLTLGVLGTILYDSSFSIGTSVTESIIGTLQDFLFARGEGSFVSRFAVYASSVEGFLERPLFGWGTERDIPGLRFPGGSHSEYFAVLYRQGIFGVITFVGLLWATWRDSRPLKSDNRKLEPANSFLRYGRWFFVTTLVNSIAADPVIDTTVYVTLWSLLGLLVATRQNLKVETGNSQQGPGDIDKEELNLSAASSR